jgi:ABC-type multidrug transport system permease subunit
MMAPLLALKTACASLTGYWFIQRFVKDKAYAVLGGLLYAFSGFMTFNIFFNHFTRWWCSSRSSSSRSRSWW